MAIMFMNLWPKGFHHATTCIAAKRESFAQIYCILLIFDVLSLRRSKSFWQLLLLSTTHRFFRSYTLCTYDMFDLIHSVVLLPCCCFLLRRTHFQSQWKREVYSSDTQAQYNQPGWFKQRITWTTLCSECHKQVHNSQYVRKMSFSLLIVVSFKYEEWLPYLRICGDNGNFPRIRIIYMFLFHKGECHSIWEHAQKWSEMKLNELTDWINFAWIK